MSFFMQTTSESLYLHKTLTTVTIMGKIRADFRKIRVEKTCDRAGKNGKKL